MEEQFLKLTKHGNFLQIAISKEHLKKHLYLTTSGGPKRTALIEKHIFNYAYTKDGDIEDVIESELITTDDVVELIETLKNNSGTIDNADRKEFVWIVTDDTVQKAVHDRVHIKSFNTADPEKFKQVTNELENFLKEKLAGYWRQNEPTPWQCYKIHKQK